MKTARNLALSCVQWLERLISPVWRARWRDLRRHALTRWQRMSSREQHLVQILAAVLVVWLILQILILPAWREVVRHGNALPTLRAEVAQVDALIQESLALGQQRGAQIAPDTIDAELAASWRMATIGTAPALTRGPGLPSAWTLTFEHAQATALIDWLAYGPAALRLSVRELNMTRDRDAQNKPIAGRVSGILRLQTDQEETDT